jgi:asparagine synthase (glutamine-hydrolysing)
MCGICGVWQAEPVERRALEKMTGVMRHRGPDDQGFYLNRGVGLASVRLSIIDLSTGKQPIANEDETVWIVFNGEIYNYPELRRELMARGHRFRTQSDTEVIVHLYEQYGTECVKRLRGMFAFALWDDRARRLLVARDPLGQKPVYYRHREHEFVFASEIKALLEDPRVRPALDVHAMHDYISVRCVPGDRTLFAGIRKLEAGEYLTVEDDRVAVERYWDLRYLPKLEGSERDLVDELRARLMETVTCHMLSDVPVGAFLSGGIDSSLVTAMMSTVSDQPISTFSIGVRERDFNELPYARMVADQYHTDHHEAIVDPHFVADLPEMLWHIEEPVDPFAFGVYAVSRLAGQHVKVVLSGDGGDEMFAGYDRYVGNQLVDWYCLVPGPLRRGLLDPAIGLLPDNFSYNNRVQKLRWMLAMSRHTHGQRYADSCMFLRFTHTHKEALYSESLWRELGPYDSSAHLLRYFNADNASDLVDRMLYTDVKTRLPDHLLMVGDRMTMAHSVEGRSPYVDQELAEFVARLPSTYKIRGRRLKYIQREVAREFLPEKLVNRRKQGFGFPLAYWFRHELRGLMAAVIQDSSLVAAGYFRREAMEALFSEHLSGRVDHNYRLWLLLNLELWQRTFVERQSRDDLRTLVQAGMTPAVA